MKQYFVLESKINTLVEERKQILEQLEQLEKQINELINEQVEIQGKELGLF